MEFMFSCLQQEVRELHRERRHRGKDPNGKGGGDVRDGPEDKEVGGGTRKDLKRAEDGGKKFAGMEVDANEEEEEMMRRVDEGKDGEVVFRRRMLERK